MPKIANPDTQQINLTKHAHKWMYITNPKSVFVVRPINESIPIPANDIKKC
jgi:hypothetical protein